MLDNNFKRIKITSFIILIISLSKFLFLGFLDIAILNELNDGLWLAVGFDFVMILPFIFSIITGILGILNQKTKILNITCVIAFFTEFVLILIVVLGDSLFLFTDYLTNIVNVSLALKSYLVISLIELAPLICLLYFKINHKLIFLIGILIIIIPLFIPIFTVSRALIENLKMFVFSVLI